MNKGTNLSCHNKDIFYFMPKIKSPTTFVLFKKDNKSGIGETASVWKRIMQLKVSSQSRKFEFNVFSIIYLNGHNF